MKIMLDTQIYDRIVATSGMTARLRRLVTRGKIVILTTFVQESELAALRDDKKRAEIEKMRRVNVRSAGGLWGVTPWGEFPWGCDGSEGGLPVQRIMSPCGGHSLDALIASTASAEADVLVTDDKRLRKRAKAGGIRCQIWTFEHLKGCVFAASGK